MLTNTKDHIQGHLSPSGANMPEQTFCTLWRGTEHIKGKSKSDIKKLFLLPLWLLWEALPQPHLDRPESSAHFGAAVLLRNFQVSPPTPEDQQSALQLPQVVSVPWREGTAIAALQVTKIRPSIKSIRAHMMDWQRWESWEREEHYQSKTELELINPWSTILRSFVVVVVIMMVALVWLYGPVFSMRMRKTAERNTAKIIQSSQNWCLCFRSWLQSQSRIIFIFKCFFLAFICF